MMSLVAHKRYSDEGVVECDEELLLNTSSSSHGRRHSAHHKTPHEVRELISLDGATPVHPDKSVSHTHKSVLLPVIHPGSHKETHSEEAGGEEDSARLDRGQTIIAKKKKGEEATVLSKRERAAIAEQLRVTEAEQHRGGPPPPPPPPAPSAKDKENARLHERRADPDYALHHRRQRHTRRSLSGEMGCSNSSFGTAANRILRRRLSAAANRVDVLPPPTRPFGEAARSVTLRRRRPRRASQEGVSVSSTSSSLSGHYDHSSMSSTSSLSSSTSSAYWSRPWEDAMSTGSHSIEHVEEQEYIESMKQEELVDKKEEEEDEVVVLDRVEAKTSLDNSTTSLTPRVSFGWQDTMQDASEKRDVKDEGNVTAQPAKSVSSASARKASAQSAPVLSATALMTKSASRGSGEAALPVVTRHASLQSNGSNVSSTGQGGGSSGSLASSNNSQYNNYGSFLYGNGSANPITSTATTTMTTTKAAEGMNRAGIPQPPRLLYETRSNSSHSNSSNNGSGMGLGSPRDSAASLSWLMYSARSSTYSSTSSNGSGSGGGGSKEPNMNGGIAAGSSSEEDIYGSSSNSNNKMVGSGKGQQQQQHVTSASTTRPAEKTASPPLLKPHEERLTLPLLRAIRPASQPSTTRAADESKAEEAGPVKLHHSSAAVSSIAVDRPQTTLHTTTTTTPSHPQCHLGQRTVEWSLSSSTGYDKLPNGATRPNSATSQRTGRRMNRRVSFIGEIR